MEVGRQATAQPVRPSILDCKSALNLLPSAGYGASNAPKRSVWLAAGLRTTFTRVDGELAKRDAIGLGVTVLQATSPTSATATSRARLGWTPGSIRPYRRRPTSAESRRGGS